MLFLFVIIVEAQNFIPEDTKMDSLTSYRHELARVQEQLDSLMRVEQRLIEKRGYGYRHPFYERKIEILNGKLCRLIMKVEAEA